MNILNCEKGTGCHNIFMLQTFFFFEMWINTGGAKSMLMVVGGAKSMSMVILQTYSTMNIKSPASEKITARWFFTLRNVHPMSNYFVQPNGAEGLGN